MEPARSWPSPPCSSRAAANVAWEVFVQPHPGNLLRDLPSGLLGAASGLPEVMRQFIGVFGWLDTGLPTLAYLVWRLLVVVVITLALLVGNRRERLVMVGTVLGLIAATLAVALSVRQTGFGVQGRYVLPIAVGVPLVAGEIIRLNRAKLAMMLPRRTPEAVAVLAGTIHAVAWYSNARRHTVGVPRSAPVLRDAEWSPPLGWVPWFAVTLSGAAALVLGTRAARHSA